MASWNTVGDDELLRQLSLLVKQSRRAEAEVVAHVAEVERRRLYARQACSSMFEYCRRVLGLRENEAYLRITVARASRQHPVLLEMLGDGRLHLSGIARLAPHLTRENAAALLERACGLSHREIRELVAELEPRPDVAPAIRKLPERPAQRCADSPELGAPRAASDGVSLELRQAEMKRPSAMEPLAPNRYLVRFTASIILRDKLERLQTLMRSSVPGGDLGRVIDIAISEKLERIEARRFGMVLTRFRGHPRRGVYGCHGEAEATGVHS
jgi:hypothetical protein